jgi:hypothetical protein
VHSCFPQSPSSPCCPSTCPGKPQTGSSAPTTRDSVLHGTGNPSYADVDARFEQATNLAPEVARYWHDRSDLEHGKADANTNPAIILEARQLACEYDKKTFDANPLELTNHYRLAFSAWELGKLGDNEKQIEAVELYVRLTGLAPADGLAAERLETLRNVLNP